MKQFKKSSTCALDSRNYIYLVHFAFKVVSLDTDEVIYEEENPFPKYNRKMQISDIFVNENLIILINFRSDFVLYKYIPETKKIEKIRTYYQKGNLERLDSYACWNTQTGFAFELKNYKRSNEYLIRYVSSNGEIKDFYYPTKVYGVCPNDINQIDLKDEEDNMYIFNNEFTSEKDIIIKREDLNNVLQKKASNKYFLSLAKINDEEYGIFEENENKISFKQYVNGEWLTIETKPVCLENGSYCFFYKDGHFGLVEYDHLYFTISNDEEQFYDIIKYMNIRYDFNNIKKWVLLNYDLHTWHVICANDKYICIYSDLSRNSVLVFNIDELDDE